MSEIKPGVMSAFLTPFDESGKVKTSAIKELVDYQVEQGLHGLYVCGSTGEGMAMSEEERMLVTETVTKAVAGRTQVIVHVGTTDTASAVRLAKHAESCGASGLSSVPPYYYTHSEEYVLDYYKTVAGSTNLPLLAYHVPSLCKGVTYSTLTKLMDFQNIVGMKYTDDNLEVLCKFKEQKNDKIVFMGHDAMQLCALVMGANGGIGAFPNIMPKGFVKVYDCFVKGNFEEAREEQLRLNHYISVIKKYMTTAIQVPLKPICKAMGVDAGVPRLPVKPISKDVEEALISNLKSEGFFACIR